MATPKTPHLPAVQPEAAPPALDAHGFNPDDFEWLPVARQPRSDGWKPSVQKRFIEELADTGFVTAAARAVGMSVTSCYRLRRAPGAEGFAAAWEAAIAHASQRLVDIAFGRAINGTEEPVLDKHGNCIHIRQRTNDRLLMFLLRAHHPEGHHNHSPRSRPDAAQAIAPAIASLAPVMPAAPQALMEPDAFADLLYNMAAANDADQSLAALSSLSPDHPSLSEAAIARPEDRSRSPSQKHSSARTRRKVPPKSMS